MTKPKAKDHEPALFEEAPAPQGAVKVKAGWGGIRPGAGRKLGFGRGRRLPSGSCIYIIVEEHFRGHCKIGRTRDVLSRLSSLQAGNWRALKLGAAYEVPEELALKIENWLHARFFNLIQRGEWFQISEKVARMAIREILLAQGLSATNLVGTERLGPRRWNRRRLKKIKNVIKFPRRRVAS